MNKKLIIIAGPLVVFFVLVTLFWIQQRQGTRPLSKPPEHGVCFTAKVETAAGESAPGLAQLQETLHKRFSHFGTPIFWETVSQTGFKIYAPITDKETQEAAAALVWQQGLLQLRLVHTNTQELITQGRAEEGFELMQVQRPNRAGIRRAPESYLVSKTAEGGSAGIRILQAMAHENSMTKTFEIYFRLTPESTEAFSRITRESIGRQLGIVVDGALLAAPVIRSEIPGGSGVISGDFTRIDAVKLAVALESALPLPVKLEGARTF